MQKHGLNFSSANKSLQITDKRPKTVRIETLLLKMFKKCKNNKNQLNTDFPRFRFVCLSLILFASVPFLGFSLFFLQNDKRISSVGYFGHDFGCSSGCCQHFRSWFGAFQVNGDDFQFCFHSLGHFTRFLVIFPLWVSSAEKCTLSFTDS